MIKRKYYSYEYILRHDIYDRDWRDKYYVKTSTGYKEIKKYDYCHLMFLAHNFPITVLKQEVIKYEI